MHKSLVTAALLLGSTLACAGPYVGLGYQAANSKVEQQSLKTPLVGSQAVDLSGSDSDGGVKLLAGYRFSDIWALELGLQQPRVEKSFERRLSVTEEEEWEVSVEGTHITLAPVLLFPVGEKLELRATLGLLYGDYDIKRSHLIDVENGPDQNVSRVAASDSKLGGMIGLGAAVRTPWKVDVLAEVQHQRTSVLSSTALSLGVVYRF